MTTCATDFRTVTPISFKQGPPGGGLWQAATRCDGNILSTAKVAQRLLVSSGAIRFG
jgi:hypothetical protein